ncbi:MULTISPECIES: cellulose biosynthesis protein BcsR [unclassified Serratia (in: enterobacteria)]
MQDDLLALSLAFSLPELNYIDILRQERLAHMMGRWPLLAELAQKTGSL